MHACSDRIVQKQLGGLSTIGGQIEARGVVRGPSSIPLCEGTVPLSSKILDF